MNELFSKVFSRSAQQDQIGACNQCKNHTHICFYNEKDRLLSFTDWSVPFIDKNLLARTGFIYYGKDDFVMCYFCYVKLSCWDVDDNVVYEHLRWSPNCKLITGRKTKNVPINLEEFKKCLPVIEYDVCGSRILRANSRVEDSCAIL